MFISKINKNHININKKKQLLRKLHKIYNTFFFLQNELLKSELKKITQSLDQYFKHIKTQRILIYKYFLSEIPILPICQELSSLSHVTFFYPNEINGSIQAQQFEHIKNHNIESHTSLETLDFVITPGIFMDQDGTRLGRGGGFYDRILHHWPIERRMFVGFSWQCFEASFWKIPLIQTQLNKPDFKQLNNRDLLSKLPREHHDQQISHFNGQKILF